MFPFGLEPRVDNSALPWQVVARDMPPRQSSTHAVPPLADVAWVAGMDPASEKREALHMLQRRGAEFVEMCSPCRPHSAGGPTGLQLAILAELPIACQNHAFTNKLIECRSCREIVMAIEFSRHVREKHGGMTWKICKFAAHVQMVHFHMYLEEDVSNALVEKHYYNCRSSSRCCQLSIPPGLLDLLKARQLSESRTRGE